MKLQLKRAKCTAETTNKQQQQQTSYCKCLKHLILYNYRSPVLFLWGLPGLPGALSKLLGLLRGLPGALSKISICSLVEKTLINFAPVSYVSTVL